MKPVSLPPSNLSGVTTQFAILAVIGQVARAGAIGGFVLGIVGVLARISALTVGGFVTCGICLVVMIIVAVVALVRMSRLYKDLDG